MDIHCRYYGDCCQDFQTSCPQESEQFQQLFEIYPFNRTFQDFQCTRFLETVENLTIPDKYFNTFIISTCPDGTKCEFRTELSDVNNSVPMLDAYRGVHYITGQCAMCNGAGEATPWEVKLNCNFDSGLVNSTDSPSDAKKSAACAVTYRASGDVRPCVSGIITSTCSASCHNQNLVTLCNSDFVSLTFDEYRKRVYKNGYCAMCNNEKTWYCLKDPVGQPVVLEGPHYVVADRDTFEGFSLGQVIRVRRVPPGVRVRPKSCPSGFVLEASDCIPEASNITVIVNGTLHSELSSQQITVLRQKIGKLEGKIHESVAKVMERFGISHRNIQIFSHLEQEILNLIVVNRIQCNCGYSSLFTTNDSITSERFQNEILSQVRIEIILYLEMRNIHLESVESEIDVEINNVTFVQHEISDCTWLVYQRNELQWEMNQ